MKRTLTLLLVPAAILVAIVVMVFTSTKPPQQLPAAATVANSKLLSHSTVPAPAAKPSNSPMAPDALSKIYSDIEQQEYHASYDSVAQTWQSPNRAQNIRTYYAPGQWKLQNRVDSAGHNWQVQIATLGIYADGRCLATAAPGIPAASAGSQVAFEYPAFTEQYFNTPEGVRQNFLIRQVPSSTKQVAVKLQVSGMAVRQQSTGVVKLTGKGQKLTYSGLKAWDANGKDIKAEIAVEGQQISLLAFTEGVAFPITIDPIIANDTPANANASLESNQAGAILGFSVSGAGDVNGDGYSDVIVGAYLYDNMQTNEGAAFVYHGSATGISNTAAAIVESNQVSASFGYSVSGAGDVNGDGYSDVIVGAFRYDDGQNNEGAAFVYHGSASGISTTAVAMLESNQAGADFGESVSGAGDVNGDGYSDVIVGADDYNNGQSGEGTAFIYHGSAGGISTTAADTVESNQALAYLGRSVSGAGDVNGDGYSDVIVGAYSYDNGQSDEGAAFVYHGSATGISTTAADTVESNQANANLGYSVSGAGDVNGDGYSDVIVGADDYNNGQSGEGTAFIYHGSAGGISTTAADTVESNQADADLGFSVSGAGDVNGDGYSDVIVGAPSYDNMQTDEGAAFIYHGSASGISNTAADTVESNQANANLGYSVSGAGDVNGDGYSDVIVGAPYYDNGENEEGAAFVYHGSAGSISTTATAKVESNQAGAQLGRSVSGAGDVNGDGYDDVIVGVPFYDNGETDEGAAFVYHGSTTGISTTFAALLQSNQADALFGFSVSGAGDVNGDGYSDVIVGASSYDNMQTDEGVFYVYHGSASGISTTAAASIESNQAEARLGFSVSGAGDVNGDGYNDVIVGAFRYDDGQNNEGAAFVYHGSATGISTTAADTVESNQPSALLGWSVSGAGDVNGDGYSDVIVGAYQYDNGQSNEGVAFMYHGSAGGISTTAADTVESNQAFAEFGFCVSGAGDVNGDGYSDVIVGADRYDNGETDEGAAFIYHGSASGISTTAADTVESNQANADLGNGVSGAGDVNGDGYSDVIVGAPGYDNGENNEGAAFVYHGSATGISTTAAAMVESNQAGAVFGNSVSGARDVNGDGYSDVIVGAHFFSNGQSGGGAFYVYQGNAGGGLRRNLRLFNTSTTTPIRQSNVFAPDFAIGLYNKNPDGRTKGKLVWESRSPGQPFSQVPVTNSTQFTARQAAFSNLGTTGTQLTGNVTKPGFATNVRVRIQYDPATAQNGQVYSPWVYLQGRFRPLKFSLPPNVSVIYVDSNKTQSGNGTSWATAFKELREALSVAAQNGSIDSILIAKGTYKPTDDNSRDIAFALLRGGLKLYGGYPSGGAGIRDPLANATILSGDIGTVNNTTDNSYHVVVAANIPSSADSLVVDGFMITKGNANGTATKSYNGQTFNQNDGAGVSLVTVQNKTIFRNCIFSSNTSTGNGGAILNAAASPSFFNCLFVSNKAGFGGGLFNFMASPILVNCTLLRDTAINTGGGIYNNGSSPVITNSIIWNNKAGTNNNAIDNSGGTSAVTYSIVQDGYAGTGNLNADPIFVNPNNPAGTDGIFGTTDDGLRLQQCSPAINSASLAALPAGTAFDISGFTRVFNTLPDMGAYEYRAIGEGSSLGVNGDDSTYTIRTGVMPLLEQGCRIVGRVTANGTSPISGTLASKLWIDASFPTYNSQPFIKRHFHLTPSNGTTATLTLYATQQEFTDFNVTAINDLPASPTDADGVARLRIYKFTGQSSDGTGLPATYAQPPLEINPDDAQVIWNAAQQRWQITFTVTGFSGFFIGAANSAILPLTLLQFKATVATGKEALLSWRTANEANTSHFELQRSSDGRSFTTITVTQAAGTAQGEAAYSYTDNNLQPGLYYYRLRMIDKDGKETYSQVVSVQFKSSNPIVLYPVPVKGVLWLGGSSVTQRGKSAMLTDIQGRVLQHIRITQWPQPVDISTLARGAYLLKMEGETAIPFMKQ